MNKKLLLLLCVILALTGCHGNSKEEASENLAKDGESLKTDLTINSSSSCLNTSFDMEHYNPETVEEIFVYVNAGTASGRSYLVTRESEEYMNDILDVFWNSDNSFSVTESGYDDYGYNCYYTLRGADEADSITIFVFDQALIRINGTFYRSAVDLDYDPVTSLKTFRLN